MSLLTGINRYVSLWHKGNQLGTCPASHCCVLCTAGAQRQPRSGGRRAACRRRHSQPLHRTAPTQGAAAAGATAIVGEGSAADGEWLYQHCRAPRILSWSERVRLFCGWFVLAIALPHRRCFEQGIGCGGCTQGAVAAAAIAAAQQKRVIGAALPPPPMRLYVGNLSWRASEEDLREAFKAFGEIEAANIVMEKPLIDEVQSSSTPTQPARMMCGSRCYLWVGGRCVVCAAVVGGGSWTVVRPLVVTVRPVYRSGGGRGSPSRRDSGS